MNDLKRIFVPMSVAAVLGAWSVIDTALISKDGVRWIEFARRIDSAERTSGADEVAGRGYLFWPDHKGSDAGMGISVGTNGISVYEHGTEYLSARAVYAGPVGSDWNHIAVTCTNKVPRIYLNGVLVRTGWASPRANVYAPRIVGGGVYGHFKGDVRCVGIWDRALTAQELGSAMTGESDGEGAVGVWMFTDALGTSADNSSGHTYQATIRGATWTASEKESALRFNGITDTVELKYPVPANSFTIAAWVRAEEKLKAKSMMARMLEIQDPGLPFMVFCWHRLLSRFGLGQDNRDWALAGQTLSLLCRMLSLIPLYYIGKRLVGGRQAFWALLVLVFLPWPAESGHDVLREWPHLLFLSGGLVLVLWAFSYGRPVLLLLAGLIGGLGHAIRPECAQLTIYAFLGLILAVLRPSMMKFSRRQALLGMICVMCGFAAFFLPYAHARGRVLPTKLKQLLMPGAGREASPNVASTTLDTLSSAERAAFVPKSMDGAANVIQRLSENQYYYFFPFMAVGLYLYFFRPAQRSFDKYFVASFIVFNCLMLAALHQHWGYVSRRHVLPLTAVTVLFVPQGLNVVAGLLSGRNKDANGAVDATKQARVFLILLGLGILICLPKLAKLRAYNIGFKKTAEYLRLNTPTDAIVAVPDARIAFYAERNYISYQDGLPEEHWDYWVVLETPPDIGKTARLHSPEALTAVFTHSLKRDRQHSKIVTYRRVATVEQAAHRLHHVDADDL